MAAPTQYSAKEKYEALKYAESNGLKNAAIKYNCSEQSLCRWKRKYDGTLESLENKYCAPYTPNPKAHTEEEVENIKEVLRLNPYISHKELYEILKKDYGYSRHPGGLYNFLRRNRIVPEPKLKNDYATMFDSKAVKRLNGKFLFNNKETLPRFLIELDNSGIFIAKEENNYPCKLTVYYSTALTFKTEKEAIEFLKSIKNTSRFKLKVKKLLMD